MERYFIFDNLNTWYDWRLILTAKSIPDANPKTNYVALDGANGTLDLSEALTGEITYNDRTISASFWTDYGTRKDREALFREITTALHGKKVQIIEPDDPDHYLYGRISIKSKKNILPYAEFTIEAVCEPWKYALEESVRTVPINSSEYTDIVITNHGDKTLCPTISVPKYATIEYNDATVNLSYGSYKVSDLKLYHGSNVIRVKGAGEITITYREAVL